MRFLLVTFVLATSAISHVYPTPTVTQFTDLLCYGHKIANKSVGESGVNKKQHTFSYRYSTSKQNGSFRLTSSNKTGFATTRAKTCPIYENTRMENGKSIILVYIGILRDNIVSISITTLGFLLIIYDSTTMSKYRLLTSIFSVGLIFVAVMLYGFTKLSFPVISICFIVVKAFCHRLQALTWSRKPKVPISGRKITDKHTLDNTETANGSIRRENLNGGSRRKLEPVSITGISCRFAQGVNSKDDFWKMLIHGKCVIGVYPDNRLEEEEIRRHYHPGRKAPGKHYTMKGAFLDHVTRFDAQFFGISPAECRALDPQQRLLLQCVYEAIEDAGLTLGDLQQCRTGVYVGLMNLDYGRLLLDDPNVPKIDEFASTGITASTVANRISYCLNLTGPSLTVDTACSSSLSALHVGLSHIQLGECDVAIVCAPNLILARYFHTACCRTGLLADDGRCKSFDITGDGYGRGEGIAAVILKPTDFALRDRDSPYAQVIACGLNNDGQHAIPMTGPSDKTQAELARRVLRESGLTRDDVEYVEAHGTGTAIGDVVEMRSISAVYGNSPTRVLRIGSVKSNINHTESTAGLAGLIKVCLMIKYGYFVPTVNVNELKPQLLIRERKMAVQLELEEWVRDDGAPRTGAVCCYGYGGANGHVIVQEVKVHSRNVVSQNRPNWVLALSARTKEALSQMSRRYSKWLQDQPDVVMKDEANVCFTLNNRRTLHTHRLALAFSSLEDAATLLDSFVDGKPGWEKFLTVGECNSEVKKLAFVYGGQGATWFGMAKEMLQHEPTFCESIATIDDILSSLGVKLRLLEELGKDEHSSRVMENGVGQMSLFAVHYALTELLRSWGITPAAVVGHSLGEISAACTAGALTVTEAVQLIILRSTLHQNCPVNGRMLAVGLSRDKALVLLRQLSMTERLDVAVVNSPKDVILSGDIDSIEYIARYLDQQEPDIFQRLLETNRAYHSHHMDEVRDEFTRGLWRIQFTKSSPTIPWYSTVVGGQVTGHTLSHWWHNVRSPVLFSTAVQNMAADGYRTFIEINAVPQLGRYIQTICNTHLQKDENGTGIVVINTLPKSNSGEQHRTFLKNCIGGLFTGGYPIAWRNIQGEGNFIRCPTYPWQEKDYWYREKLAPHCVPVEIGGPVSNMVPDCEDISCSGSTMKHHPLLGHSVPAQSLAGLHVWESELNTYALAYLTDHKFQDIEDCVIPAAVYVEMALAVVLDAFKNACPRLKRVTFKKLMTVGKEDVLKFRTRLQLGGQQGDESAFKITAVQQNDTEVLLSEGCVAANGVLTDSCKEQKQNPTEPSIISVMKNRLVKQHIDKFHEKRVKRQFKFGPQFSLITETWRGDHEALCLISLTEDHIKCTNNTYVLHPTIIDACFQTLFLVGETMEKPVPHYINDVVLFKNKLTSTMYCHILLNTDNVSVISLIDSHGDTVLLMNGFVMADLSNLQPKLIMTEVIYDIPWVESPQNDYEVETKSLLVIPDAWGFAKQFVEQMPVKESSFWLDLIDREENGARALLEQTIRSILARESNVKLCVVNFLPIHAAMLDGVNDNFNKAHAFAFESSLLILQTILSMGDSSKGVHLALVTSGSVYISGDYRDLTHFPWASTLLGFRRTVTEEATDPKTTVLDLSPNPSADDFQIMFNDLRRANLIEEVAYRCGKRYTNHIERLITPEAQHTKSMPILDARGDPRPFQIFPTRNQTRLIATRRKVTRKGYVEMKVAHVGPMVNKKSLEVLVFGVVADSGPVFTIRDASSVGNFIHVKETDIVSLDKKLTMEEAACLVHPMAVSVYVVRDTLACCDGQSILVYAKEEVNAVVFACVAKCFGAQVTILKRNTWSELKKRDTILFDTITEQDILVSGMVPKMDVVVCLGKPPANILHNLIDLIKDDGKLLNVHRQDHKPTPICVTRSIYIGNASLDGIVDDPHMIGEMVNHCCGLLESKNYLEAVKRLPFKNTPIFDVVGEDPFSDQKSLSLGSENGERMVDFVTEVPDNMVVKENRTYLVVGGVRGFGFEVVRWLVSNGAKTLVCTARSPPSPDKQLAVLRLQEEHHCRIIIHHADVTSMGEMTSLLEELDSLPEIAGIVFSAMVLEDQRIKDADFETCARVVATKVKGSVVLHQLSLKLDLDFFIMFSSIAGVVGNVGQLAYSAANSFLDALCQYRKQVLGLPGVSVDWGTMGGAGILERSKDIANLFKSYGFRLMSCEEGLNILNEFLTHYPYKSQLMLCDIDWNTYLKSTAYVLHNSPRLRLMRDEVTSDIDANGHIGDSQTTLSDLEHRGVAERRKIVETFVRKMLSTWTEGNPEDVDLNLSLFKYGVDSIGAANMSLQMRNWIGALFEIYYFIQPKTNGISLINDTLKQVDELSQRNSHNPKDDSINTVYKGNEGVIDGIQAEEITDGCDSGENLACLGYDDKIVPLYEAEQSVVNVYMVHSSHRSAFSNTPFAVGFHEQDSVSLYSIGVDEDLFGIHCYDSVENLAQRYIKLIKTHKKHGPYYFAGFSFGGTIIYEIASQLTRDYEDVAMVTMLDTFPWYPTSSSTEQQLSDMRQLSQTHFKETVVRRFLKTVAIGEFELSPENYEQMTTDAENAECLLRSLGLKTKEDIRIVVEQLQGLVYQTEQASMAHFNWKPSQIDRYGGTITYLLCQDSMNVQMKSPLWNAIEAWQSLSSNMVIFTLPCTHFDLLDQPYAQFCGQLLMSTALIRHRGKYSIVCHAGQRSLRRRRCVEWLKAGIPISLWSTDEGFLPGKLALSEDENSAIFRSDNKEENDVSFFVEDVHNIVPGDYVYELMISDKSEMRLDLVVSVLSTTTQYHMLCTDWKQRDSLMEAWATLMKTTLLKH